jgi:adenine-specific DNA-methyltransferase
MLIPNFEYVVAVRRSQPIAFKGQERSLASYKQDDDGRWWRTMPIQATGVQNSWFTIVDPATGKGYHGNWAFSEVKITQMVDAGKIRFPKNDDGKPVQIVYADEMSNDKSPIFANLGRFDSETSTKQLIQLFGGKKLFDFPKPLDLLVFLIDQVTGPTDTVLDFFSGSATTAHAVMQLNAQDGGNRRHIQVQLPEPTGEESEARKIGLQTIADISRKRIDLAGRKIDEELQGQLFGRPTSLDTGYRTYVLADTNFSKWRVTSEIDDDALQQRLLSLRDSSSNDDATPDDLLTEILLKQGYSLTEKISSVRIADLDLRSVLQSDGDVAVLAYLNEHVKPTLEQLRAIVDADPSRIVIIEDAFHGDDELKTNLVQLTKSKNIELWTA